MAYPYLEFYKVATISHFLIYVYLLSHSVNATSFLWPLGNQINGVPLYIHLKLYCSQSPIFCKILDVDR